jgi:excisionase family DNA binding protein
MKQQIFSTYSDSELSTIISNAVESTISRLLKSQQKDPELLTRMQVTQILGISLPTLDEYTKIGLIPAFRIGTRIRYKKEDVYNALNDLSKIKHQRKAVIS